MLSVFSSLGQRIRREEMCVRVGCEGRFILLCVPYDVYVRNWSFNDHVATVDINVLRENEQEYEPDLNGE